MKKLLTWLLGLATIGGAVVFGLSKYQAPTTTNQFRTVALERGDLVVTVGATGTVEPEEVVDIGAQVLGRIKELGVDPAGTKNGATSPRHVDYGTEVEEGMLLAQIDPALYQAQFDQAKASVDNAKANILQLEAKLMQADAEWQRAERLKSLKITSIRPPVLSNTASSEVGSEGAEQIQIKGISDADHVLAKANYNMAKANIEIGKAQLAQAAATLSQAETNLSYTVIRSPVKGTIIDRRVNVGQTVVSAMNAPSLFLIARDLRRMQVWASVNEADIGRLKAHMPVHFTVDAFPDEIFRGEVAQIRLNASMTQNVVTYTVVISADNSDLKLLPYLTADVQFEVQQRKDVWKVPTAALRFKPLPEQVAATSHGDEVPSSDPKRAILWTQADDGKTVAAIPVTVGISDGSMTEVSGNGLRKGLEFVVGEVEEDAASAEGRSPFAPPKIPRSRASGAAAKEGPKP
ncbi:MAG: hypothetical protein C0483_23205 [Pirellula sp.]|nr:hypothetical protein [Pirellula sp.]